MSLVTHSFDLDITPGAIPRVVNVSEYDENREYTVTLRKNGVTWSAPSGTAATIEGTLAGHPFSVEATVSGNTVTFSLDESMTAYAGDAWVKIKLVKDSKPIQTCAFILRNDRAGAEADTIINAPGFQGQIQEAVSDYLDKEGVVSPTVEVSEITGGHRLTITDVDHPSGQTVDVMDGFELPSGGQSGQALLSDGNNGATWGEAGIPQDVKTALLACFQNVAWVSDQGANLYAVLEAALNGTEPTPTPTPGLPSAYQQVEYIANPSNAYIVTSIPIPLGYTVHGKAYLSAKPSQAVNVCGGDNKGATTNWTNVSFCCYSAATENYVGTFYGSTNCFDSLADLYASPLEFTTVHTASNISISLKNSGGEKSKTVSKSNVIAVDALNVFRASADAPNPFTGRIYLLEVLDANNQATAKLIPCYRKSDNAIGMYDTVNKAFYTSANSTAFTKGGDVA